jgi:hypothetical protein
MLYQPYLPGPFPLFKLLFLGDRRLGSFVWLQIDKLSHLVFAGESFNQTLFVIPYSLYQIRCHADI